MTQRSSSTRSQDSSLPLPRVWLLVELESRRDQLHGCRRYLREVHLGDPESDLGQAAYAAMTHLLPALADVDRLVALVRGAPGRDDLPAP